MENISISVSEHPQSKEITLLAVKGDIDTITAPKFSKKILSVLDEKKFKLVIDLTDVNYISSKGWSVFISIIKSIRDQKGDLVLAGMTPQVSDVFGILEFGKIFKAFPNVESAVKNGFGN